MSKSIDNLLRTLALIAAIAFVPAHAQTRPQTDELAADALVLVNLIRQRLDACRDTGDIGKADLQNAAISAKARPALNWNPKLAAIAAGHAANMAHHKFFDHVDPQGASVAKRADAAGYAWKAVAENIAAGHDSLADAMLGWLQSASHCRSMIDARFTEIGIAKVASDDEYGSYWVMVLGKPQQAGQPARVEWLAANAAAAADALMAALN